MLQSRDIKFFLGGYFFGAPCKSNKAVLVIAISDTVPIVIVAYVVTKHCCYGKCYRHRLIQGVILNNVNGGNFCIAVTAITLEHWR